VTLSGARPESDARKKVSQATPLGAILDAVGPELRAMAGSDAVLLVDARGGGLRVTVGERVRMARHLVADRLVGRRSDCRHLMRYPAPRHFGWVVVLSDAGARPLLVSTDEGAPHVRRHASAKPHNMVRDRT